MNRMNRFIRHRLANSQGGQSREDSETVTYLGPSTSAEPDEIDKAIAVLTDVSPLDIQRRGYYFQARNYYSPLNDIEFLRANIDLWTDRPLPAGIDWDLEKQLAMVRLIAQYAQELRDVPVDPPQNVPLSYYWNNDFWRSVDAFVHYALLRWAKPARVVEIGCGWSSLLLKRALLSTESHDSIKTAVHQVEPYPRAEIMASLPSHWTLDETVLQRAPLTEFERLQKGDVLFYDGSHVARTASDVNWFFFEVLPRVAPGVIVHVHDIFWPADYPETWIFDRGQTWNEQYVLQAFLMYNRDFEILLANAALVKQYRSEFEQIFSGLADELGSGGSVWFERTPHY